MCLIEHFKQIAEFRLNIKIITCRLTKHELK